jgi:hypothetical protein
MFSKGVGGSGPSQGVNYVFNSCQTNIIFLIQKKNSLTLFGPNIDGACLKIINGVLFMQIL